MKILVIAAGPLPMGRGTPARTLRVSDALAARGHDVCIAAFPVADESIKTKLRIERSEPAWGYDKTSSGPSIAKFFVMNPRLVATACDLLEREPFDVIYAHHYEGLLVASAARRRAGVVAPIIFDSHTLLGSELGYYFPRFLAPFVGWIGGILDQRLFRRADAIISVTDEISNFYASKAPPDLPIVTATNGVEVEQFTRVADSGDDPSPVRIVFAGNLSGYQGFDLLLKAFRKLRRQHNDIELLVAASGAKAVLEAMGIQRPELDGIIVCSGSFSELPQILAAADIATNPRTVCPGIPQKLLNYMAASLPTVSFEGSAAILEHERTGLIVANGDIDAFAAAIERLVNQRELRLELGNAARALVESDYNWPRVAVIFERVYHTVQHRAEDKHAKQCSE